MAGVVAALATLASGCGSDNTEPIEPAQPVGSGLPFGLGETRAPTGVPTTSPRRTTPPAPTTSTKSGAQAGGAFDPCSVSWSDFPVAVRPADPTAKGVKSAAPKRVDAMCLFNNSTGAAANVPDPAGPGAFALRVIWSTQLDPAQLGEVATRKTWNGKAGGIRPYSGPEGKGCNAQVAAYGGLVGIQIINNKYPETDPCAVADAVLTAITAKAP